MYHQWKKNWVFIGKEVCLESFFEVVWNRCPPLVTLYFFPSAALFHFFSRNGGVNKNLAHFAYFGQGCGRQSNFMGASGGPKTNYLLPEANFERRREKFWHFVPLKAKFWWFLRTAEIFLRSCITRGKIDAALTFTNWLLISLNFY